MTDFKTERYSASKPSFDQNGAYMTVYFNNDSFMNIDVDMSWDSIKDVVDIDQIKADYYDADDNEASTDGMDLEQMVIDICEHFKTFGSVENEMAKAYQADHA